ncbi:hypothetical protein BGZ46_008217 [Entomortierella lignicola]|nr:hypothetical protein BGZ46_008217 [Entomortierella lignicola]
MKLFKLDFGIKDRYRRGLAQGARATRSPQTESTVSFNDHSHEHDPHHQATSPSSPSVLFSADGPSLKSQNEPMEHWNQFGSSLESSFATEVKSNQNNEIQGYAATTTHPLTRSNVHQVQENDSGHEYGSDNLSDGYLSSSSSTTSSLSLSPSSSYYSSSSEESDSDDDDYSDDDDDTQEQVGVDDADNHNSVENDSSGFSYNQKLHFDYYNGRRRDISEHGGMLPPAPVPAIEPISNRDALEEEARQRRLERHIDKRRQSLNGNQPPPVEAERESTRNKGYIDSSNTEVCQVDRNKDSDGDVIDEDDVDEDDVDEDGADVDSDRDEGDDESEDTEGESDDIGSMDYVLDGSYKGQDEDDDDTIFSPEPMEECSVICHTKQPPLSPQGYIFDSISEQNTIDPTKGNVVKPQQKQTFLTFIRRSHKAQQLQCKSLATITVTDPTTSFKTLRATPVNITPMSSRAFNFGKM